MTKKPNMVTVTFMAVLTFFIIFFAYYMPDYFGEIRTFFYVLALISGVKTLTMVPK